MSPNHRTFRLQVMMTPEEIQAIDDWRFAQRQSSRATAVRQIMQRGMMVADQKEEDPVQ
jgi:hypothetical protein